MDIIISNLEKKSVKKVSGFLQSIGHSDIVNELSDTARTAKDAASALRVPVGAIVKSLFFLIHNGREVLADAQGELQKGRDILGDKVFIAEDGMVFNL